MTRKNNSKFVYPERQIIDKSKATINAYTHPVIKIIFWDRYKTAFNFLKQNLSEQGIAKYDCILEVGTSFGFFLPSLCQLSFQVVGSDIEDTFNFCKDITLDLIKESHENLILKSADVRKLNQTFKEESFDVILAFSVFEHIDDFEIALENVYNCLKPNGFFVCELPSENSLYKLGRKIAGYHDAHPGYNHDRVVSAIEKKFQIKNQLNSPHGLPIFKIGIYTK